MATTHVFIVDKNTFKYHLEYLFAGTGAKDYFIDFNDNENTKLHSNRELLLVGMITDIERIRKEDFIIFYLQQNFSSKIYEGKFYGVFKVKSLPFLDNNNKEQFLKKELNKSLTFRVLLNPYSVYARGVTEWEALDEIKSITSPYQMLWSLIYRKLKGNRGSTMITIYESERLIELIKQKNNRQNIQSKYFSFDVDTQEIISKTKQEKYTGRREEIKILKRLIKKYNNKKAFEIHLQAYIIQNIGNDTNKTLDDSILQHNRNIEWIGNEISCGVGMQKIDIGISLIKSEQERIFIPIELKAIEVSVQNIKQIQRYINWIKQYYIPNRISEIKPILVCKKCLNKNKNYDCIIKEMDKFYKKNRIKLTIVEYELQDNILIFDKY